MTRAACLGLALVLTGAFAAAARADGLPVVGVDVGASGVLAPAGDARYVTLPAGRDTLVVRVDPGGGTVLASRLVPGRFTIAAVAYDGSAAGLSADGRTLVLIRPRARFPRARTAFAVFNPERMRLRGTMTLRGDFSFDALSPNGSWLYLVEYLSPRDPTRYLVRLYDLRARRLLPEPIIDPAEVGNVMRGSPITRAASPDGRWAYTLYDGAGGHPFIHALDTVERKARCIDLHDLAGYPNLSELRIDGDDAGQMLTVVDGRDSLAVVDLTTFRVSDPPERGATPTPARSAAAHRSTQSARDDGSFPWVFAVAPAFGALLAVGSVGILRVRRRRRLAST
jgi:DNA-binding beta-propeller fold protein YncE